MSKFVQAIVETVDDAFHFDHHHEKQFMDCIKSTRDVVAVIVTEELTPAEFEQRQLQELR